MVERRCPDTGQIINFPADCAGCEFSRLSEEEKICSYNIKTPGGKKKPWR